MKNVIIFILVIVALFTFWFYQRNPLITIVRIGEHKFTVDLAITDREKELGLGGRTFMKPDHGMLFPYDHKDQYHFWMKGMQIPIDIVWIRDNNIVDISKNVPIATSGALPVYTPSTLVNKVLELNAGTTDRLGIKIGDVVVVEN